MVIFQKLAVLENKILNDYELFSTNYFNVAVYNDPSISSFITMDLLNNFMYYSGFSFDFYHYDSNFYNSSLPGDLIDLDFKFNVSVNSDGLLNLILNRDHFYSKLSDVGVFFSKDNFVNRGDVLLDRLYDVYSKKLYLNGDGVLIIDPNVLVSDFLSSFNNHLNSGFSYFGNVLSDSWNYLVKNPSKIIDFSDYF